MYTRKFTYTNKIVHIYGSVKTGPMDYDDFDEMLTFEHMLLMILYRNQTKFGIRKRITKSSLLLFKDMAKRNDWFSQCQSYMHMFVYIPIQVVPSSSNTKPLLHSQLKPPTVFIHI